MQIVTIIEVEDNLELKDPSEWFTQEVEDIRFFLMEQFPEWPETARIYHKEVSQIHDVTPACKEDVDRLGELEGPFYVIVFPGHPAVVLVFVVIAVAMAVIMMLMAPPLPTMRNTNSESPNNELSARTNKARPMARIPDIYGQVWSTLDLIAVPYSIFEDHQEVEIAYMCRGRGACEVATIGSTYEIRDDTTLVNDIAGTTVEVYGPNTSPNSGDEPEIRIGAPIGELVRNMKRFTGVNGQTLRPPNEYSIKGNSDIYFETPNLIKFITSSSKDFTEYFAATDQITIQGAYNYSSFLTEAKAVTFYDDGSLSWEIPSIDPLPYAAGLPLIIEGAHFYIGSSNSDLSGEYQLDDVSVVEVAGVFTLTATLNDPSSVNSDWSEFGAEGVTEVSADSISLSVPDAPADYNLDGTYEALSVAARTITLSDPAAVNSDWSLLAGLPGGITENLSPTLSTSGDKWVGPITMDVSDLSRVLTNFICQQGLYMDDGQDQYGVHVRVELELTPVDAAGDPTGAAETFQTRIHGSPTEKGMRAASLWANPTFTGPCKARARRVTKTNTDFEGSVVDEVKWRDLWSQSPTGKTDFGNVTTVLAKTYATTGATAVKERKLRMLATTKLPVRVSGSTFTTELYATTNAADIISAVCLDSFIGRRQISEIDFDSIYDIAGISGEISTYFGTSVAAQFNYTFDSDNLSFEEIISTIATAIHCLAYRRGNIIKLNFEKETDDSTLLFNHRNKIPGSETRTQSFGYLKDYDGVEYQWVDPDDDAVVTMYLPTNRSSINPQKIESVGIRNGLQAYMHIHRIWNKICYQNLVTEFEACSEANLLVLNDRILVADNTRTDTQDGEVVEQDALILTLSQPVTFADGVNYTIFLQLADKRIDSISISERSNLYEVTLSRAPLIPLVLDPEMYAKTTYMIVGDDDTREKAFLMTEKEPQSNFTFIVRAVNYDSRYYANDNDYINGVIDINGNTI